MDIFTKALKPVSRKWTKIWKRKLDRVYKT